MKALFNIFTILKQFILYMILRIAQNIEDNLLQDYYVNYKFKSIDGLHSFEMPIIFEVRDENEMSLLHGRIITDIINSKKLIITHNNPVKISKHKKISLLKEKAYLKDSELSYKVRFMKTLNDGIMRDSDLQNRDFKIKVLSTKTPKKGQKEIYPIGILGDLFVMEILTDNLK